MRRRAALLALSLATTVSAVACREKAAPSGPSAPPLPDPPGARAPSPGSVDLPPTTTREAAPFTPERVQGEGSAMGTHLAFAAYTTPTVDAAKARAAFEAAITEIRRIEAVMTTWRPESEISRVNAAAGKAPVAVSDETLEIVKESIRASEMSGGAFDITFETLHGLWKFDEDLDPHPPNKRDVDRRLGFVGYKNIVVDGANKTVMLAKSETRIGLGGIAKGYAVDRAVAVLDGVGLTSFFVQAGGDLFARGKKPDGTAWQAGIRDPRGPESRWFAKIPLSDHAFSTAGDYERSYLVGGVRYHHILDPRTGQPARACRSVTVWAPTALLADQIDDAVFVLGPQKGLELVESVDGVGAVVVDAKNNVWISKRMRGVVELAAAPTDGP